MEFKGKRRGDYTGFNMSLEGEAIKQQNCKSCNIRYEQKDAHLGVINPQALRYGTLFQLSKNILLC
jgi:hypothetical protein